jgi:acetyl esterase/lipase
MTFDTISRPLHPQVQASIDAADPGRPKLYDLDPAAARAQVAGVAALIGPGPAVAVVRDVEIPAGAATIPARVYEPHDSQGTIVWFHGGGWVIGGLDTHDAMCRTLAGAARCRVVNVAYRLAPEHPFPAPLEDAWTALSWASAQYPSAPLVVGGDSAGGNLAAVCAIRSRDRGGPALALQVLVYPVTDHDLTTASYLERGAEDGWLSRRSMQWYWDRYVPDPADRANPEASPLRTPDLSGLAAAVVVTAEYDPLRDEGRAYAQRLHDAGVPVTADHYADMAHPFFEFVDVFERSNEAIERVAQRIRAAVTAAAPPVPQLLLPGQAAAPGGPVDVAPMYLIHRAFRRDTVAFTDVVPTVAPADRARWTLLARRFDLFATVLHKHHSGEDAALWPLLAERGADPAVLDALQAEHAGIDPALAATRADLRTLADGAGDAATRDRLAATTARLRDALDAHLAHEERNGMALVQRHLTQRDWDRLDREVFAKDYTLREVPEVLGWVLSGLAPEHWRRLPGANPVFLAFGRLMARRFDRREARIFGGAR